MRFHGRYHKGYMRQVRELKREEAEARNRAYQERQAATLQRVREGVLGDPQGDEHEVAG